VCVLKACTVLRYREGSGGKHSFVGHVLECRKLKVIYRSTQRINVTHSSI